MAGDVSCKMNEYLKPCRNLPRGREGEADRILGQRKWTLHDISFLAAFLCTWAEGSLALLRSYIVRRPSVSSALIFHIFDFSSETAEWNSRKLNRKQDLNVFYQVRVFRLDRKNKMAALASDWLRHFRLLLWNRWTEFNETWQEARSNRPLPSLCFFSRIWKTWWLPWPLIGWDIFDFSEETAERNLTKLDR